MRSLAQRPESLTLHWRVQQKLVSCLAKLEPEGSMSLADFSLRCWQVWEPGLPMGQSLGKKLIRNREKPRLQPSCDGFPKHFFSRFQLTVILAGDTKISSLGTPFSDCHFHDVSSPSRNRRPPSTSDIRSVPPASLPNFALPKRLPSRRP